MKTYHHKGGIRREAVSLYPAPRFTLFPATVNLPEFVGLFKNFVTCSAISLGRCPITSLYPESNSLGCLSGSVFENPAGSASNSRKASCREDFRPFEYA